MSWEPGVRTYSGAAAKWPPPRLQCCAGLILVMVAGAARTASPPEDPVEFAGGRVELLRDTNRLAVALPGGRMLEFATRSEALGLGATGVYGRSAGGDRLIVFATAQRISGDIYASGGRYRLLQDAGRLYWSRYSEPAGGGFLESARTTATVVRAPLPIPPSASPAADGAYEIDLLVLYTDRYAAAYENVQAAVSNIQNMVFRANVFFRTSSIPVRYRVVGIEAHAAAETYGTPSFGGEPAVVARRDALGADLVALFENGVCAGQATPFNHSTPAADGAEPGDVDPERDAFALVIATPVCDPSDFLLAHELGHTLGGGHEVLFAGVQAVPNPIIGQGYWKEYAHGTRCGDAGGGGAFKYVSIMAYGLPNQAVATDVKGDFFSNPDFMLDGEACGAEGTPGIEATRADNARSITLAAPYVAAYRTAVDAKSDATKLEHRGGATDLWASLLLLTGALTRRRRRLNPV